MNISSTLVLSKGNIFIFFINSLKILKLVNNILQ